jgi:hypothetical protein
VLTSSNQRGGVPSAKMRFPVLCALVGALVTRALHNVIVSRQRRPWLTPQHKDGPSKAASRVKAGSCADGGRDVGYEFVMVGLFC